MPHVPTCLLWVTLLAASALPFDRILLKDGRIIDEGRIVASDDPDEIVLRLQGADIPIPMDMVDKTFVEDLEDYVPRNDKEREYLEKGWVLFEGKWMSRTRRETELEKRREADREALEQARAEQDWKNRKEMETRHFHMVSNCTQAVMDQYAELLEDYYKSFVDYWHIKLSPSEGKDKMTFYLYRTKRDFHDITRMPYNVGGFFSFLDRELQLYDIVKDRTEAQAILFHEGNHLLTYLIDTRFRYPTWMNEGMAEYYGTANVDDRGDFELGGLQYGRIVSLQRDAFMGKELPLREVLLTEQSNFGARHYAVAWSFIHFLMESPEYGKSFRIFFKTLPHNRDIEVENKSYRNVTGSLAEPDLASVVTALENELGTPLDELEQEWREYRKQAYGELTAGAYFDAARLYKLSPGKGSDLDENVRLAMEYYGKAVELGIDDPDCYREYAEMLRKGGIDEWFYSSIVSAPDPAKGWEMAQRAVELDPIEPLNYCEAAGCLMMDGTAQDLDRALRMAQTAKALDYTNPVVRSLVDELLAKIQPALEREAARAAGKAVADADDHREWHVQPFYLKGEEAPAPIEPLTTAELSQLILDGEVKGEDWVFQSWRDEDPETGELLPGTEPWELNWVALKDVPDFARDLEAAAEPASAGEQG